MEGVVTAKSGLQYKILKEGTGKSPAATDQVTVNYRFDVELISLGKKAEAPSAAQGQSGGKVDSHARE
jgi:hypothetical protein